VDSRRFDVSPARYVRTVKELPDDLAALDAPDLAQQRALRDEHLAPLFRRWPALSRHELRELMRVYGERLHIARYLGKVRSRRSS
jgi:hypothetical protein